MLLLIRNYFSRKYLSLQKKMELHAPDVIWYNNKCLPSLSPLKICSSKTTDMIGPCIIQGTLGLHISRDTHIERVQVDPGSALSIILKRLLYFLGIPLSRLLTMTTTIYGFNAGSSHPLGKICLWHQIGDLKLEVTYYVIDAVTSYNLLLWQPWIHAN